MKLGRRQYILIGIITILLVIGVAQTPTPNHELQIVFPAVPSPLTPAGIGDNLEDFVDQVSDLHAPSDIGTHSVFADLQDYGANYDLMTEANQGSSGFNLEDFVDTTSDLHAPSPDVGTHSSFAEMQDKDGTYDTLTEANTGGAGGSEWISVNAFDNTYNAFDITFGADPWLDAQDEPTNYRGELASGDVQLGWFDFPSTTLTGTITVNISCYTRNEDGAGNDWLDVWVDYTGSGAGSDVGDVGQHLTWSYDTIDLGSHTVSEVNNLRVYFQYKKSGGGDDVLIDHVRLGVSVAGGDVFDLDLEVGWTAADFDETNEELCIFGGTQGSEALRVDYWTGSWTNVITDLVAGWNNNSVSITSAAFEIRFTDTSDEAVLADTWQVEGVLLHVWTDAVNDYELDLEVGWTAADFDETNEELCIYPVTGGGWPAEAILVDIWAGSWSNVFTDLTPDQWNNQSVSLTGAAIEIRFLGGTEEGDTTQSTWEIDAVLLHTWTPSYDPVNDQAPTLDNPTESSKMFAQYIEYKVTAYVSDANTFDNIDYLEIGFWDDTQTTEYWRFRYDEDTNTFSEEYDIGTVVSLNTGSSIGTESGDDIDAQFWFTVDWDHADIAADGDAKCYVIDAQSNTDTDWYEVTWTVETRLDYSVSPSVTSDDSGTVDRGDLDETFFLGGTLEYYGSTSVAPPSDQVDAWVSASEYGTNVGPWSDLTLTSGAFEVTCYADDLVGEDTYTIKPVIEAAGSGGTSLYYTTDLTDTYIADQITVQTTTADDTRVDINSNSEIRVTLWLEHDDTYLGSGDSVTLDDTAMTWDDGNSWFDLVRSQASVDIWMYFVNSSSEAMHGVTGLYLNSQEVDVIWDRVQILTTTSQDDRIDISTTADLRVTAQLEYDSHTLGTSDTLYMDDIQMSWNAGGWFEYGPSQGSVDIWNYYVNSSSANEATYGITVVNLDGNNQDQIWDRIKILTTTAGDGRIDYGTSTTISVTAELEYDSHALGSGDTLYMNDTAMSWGGSAFELTAGPYNIVDLFNHFVNSSSANEATYGVTVVNLDGKNVDVIWDRIKILTTTTQDGRIDYNTQADIQVTAELEFDSHALGSGDTLYMNDTSMSWVSSYFQLQPQFAEVDLWRFFVNSSNANEATYGITVVNLDGNNQDQIWDRIKILTTTTQDGRIDYDTEADIRVTAELEYDSHALDASDTLYMNDTSMSWVSTYFQLQPQFAEVDLWRFFINSSSANEATYGITVINLDGNNQDQIWDRIIILTTATQDSRIDYNTQADIRVTAELEYDSHALGSGDTLYMNDTAMSWVSSYFQLQPQFAEVDLWRFFVNSSSANEVDYGITVINLDGNNQDQIWDRVVFDIQADDETPTNDQEVSFTVTVTYDYDAQSVTTFQIQVDRNATNWYVVDQTNYTTLTDTNSDLKYLYNASSVVSETTYGLSAFTTNTETVVWSGALNDPPVNETAPVLTNPSDITFLYARWIYYIITSNVSDLQGYGDIDYVELSLYTNDQGTEKWRLRYDEDTNAFSVELGSGIVVVGAWSQYAKSGDTLDITWYIKIDWDHGDLNDIDTKQYVYDSQADSDTDWYESDWDTECRITYTITPYLSDDRGDINTNDLEGDGTIAYYGSSINPRANETDVWISHDVSGTWSGDVDGSGAFTITAIGSSAAVRENTYTFKVVAQGTGSGGTDLYFTTSKTDIFITDQIEFYQSGVDDGRINVGITETTYWLARYDFDKVVITSGMTAALNISKSLSYNGTHWVHSESKGSVQKVGYQVESASETGYGLSVYTQTAGDTNIIWDSLTCTITDPSDQRININANASGMAVSAIYDFDSTSYDGALVLNDTTYEYATMGKRGYTVATATGDSYGITLIDTNDETYCIWDQVLVSSIDMNYTYVDHGETIQINITLIYDYDDAQITAGTFAINTESLIYIELGRWQVNITKSDAFQKVLDELTTCDATLYGITVHTMNGNNESAYWDKIEFYYSSVVDSRIDMNTPGYSLWLARLKSASSVIITSGLSANVTGDLALSYSDGFWRSVYSSISVTNFTYGIIFASLDAIEQYEQTADNVTIIWDQMAVIMTTIAPSSQSATLMVYAYVTIQLVYDNTPVESGTIYLDSREMSWDSSASLWVLVFTENAGSTLIYFVNDTSSEDVYGITTLDRNGTSASVEWGPAPESGSGHDYDRPNNPNNPILVTQSTLVLALAGVFLIGYVYLYGIPFTNIDELEGLTDQERRILYRSVLDQFHNVPKTMKNLMRKLLKRMKDILP